LTVLTEALAIPLDLPLRIPLNFRVREVLDPLDVTEVALVTSVVADSIEEDWDVSSLEADA
jgi:hypothetical protein